MKALHIFISILLCATPLYAEQALVLTEIEQIQEKIWYLQRDLATQKTTLSQQVEQVKTLSERSGERAAELKDQVAVVTQSIASFQQLTAETESRIQALNEGLFELSEKVKEQNSKELERVGNVGALEGSLQALREELTIQRSRDDQVMAEMREQLIKAQAQLDSLQQGSMSKVEKYSLWGGAAILLLAIILTMALALGNSRRNKKHVSNNPTRHEL